MDKLNNQSLETAETRFFTFADAADPFRLEGGETLGPVTLAYETYGRLNEARSNAILVCHALTGDAHAAGWHKGDKAPGWWDDMIGPGRAFDTEKYFVICSNVIGGCQGSTGPASIHPATGQPYGLDFPLITIGDMTAAQVRLIDNLGINKLLTVAGGSMGGMQVLEWMASHTGRIRSAIPIATALKHSPQQIAFNEVGRQAIMADANWKGGRYYNGPLPARGLAVARMVGHITYMSDTSMTEKFGRRQVAGNEAAKFSPDFEVEGYLRHRGKAFVGRFDANSYLYITKALDTYDASRGRPLGETFPRNGLAVLVVAFKSDWLYPAYQSQEIVRAVKLAGLEGTFCEIKSSYGHDAFLLETGEETRLISHFLDRVSREAGG